MSRPLLRGKDAAIARVVHGSNTSQVGMAIVVGPRHVVTCAHVVNIALDLPPQSTPIPKTPVLLEFPLLGTTSRRLAVIAKAGDWHPIGRTVASDVAVLELAKDEADIPPAVGYATFADVTGRSADGDALSVYGIVANQRTGEHISARFIGPARDALVQIDSTEVSGRLIRPGFSGGGVYDEHEQALVGMIQSGQSEGGDAADPGAPKAQSNAAYMLPTAIVVQLVPRIRVEERRRPAWFSQVWSVAAIVLLVLDVAHHWVSQQGGGPIAWFALFERTHPQLAAFAGMHVIALLGPALFALLFCYARDFPCGHWSLRVAPFPFWADRWLGGPRPTMSAVVVLLFIVVPIFSQGHFLLKFHKEGNVYVSTKLLAEAKRAQAGACLPEQNDKKEFCTHPEADLYSSVENALVGSRAFFGYAYQYGEPRSGVKTSSVTFFPVLQPVAILLLSLVGLVVLAFLLRAVFSPRCGSSSLESPGGKSTDP